MNKKVILIITIVIIVLVAGIAVWVINTVRGAANPVISSGTESVISDVYDSMISVESTYYDRFSNYGEKCALYNEKIYYFSNEIEGINGIYRMDDNGENVELLIECADIKNITVYEEKLYFIGLTNYYEPYSKDKWEIYSIYESNDFKSITLLRKSIVYPSAYNAYFYDDEVYLVNYGYPKWNHYVGQNLILNGNTPVKMEFSDDRYQKIGSGNVCSVDLKDEIENHDIFALGIRTDEMNTEDFLFRASFYDNETKARLLYGPEDGSLANAVFDDNGNLIVVQNENNADMYIDVIETISGDFDIIDTMKILTPESFGDFTVDTVWSNSLKLGVAFTIPFDAKYNARYVAAVIDLSNCDMKNIYTLDEKNDYILYYDEKTIYTLEGSHVYKHSYKSGDVTETKELVKLENGYYKFDFCGDWIFVYKQYKNLPADVLCYKINFTTDKVIKNDEQFNMKQHEKIFINQND